MKSKHVLVLLIWIIIVFPTCKKDKTLPKSGPVNFETIKTNDWRFKIGDTIEVNGYLRINEDGTAILLSDKKDLDFNGLIPETKYIALGSEIIRTLNQEQYYLAKVKIKGRIRATSDPGRTFLDSISGDLSQFEIEAISLPTVIEASPGNFPVKINPCTVNPALCTSSGSPFPEKYALLYSGGVSKDKAYKRYWNDIALYYQMLVNKFGYLPRNIIVIYKNGIGEDLSIPVDYAATKDGLNAAFLNLASKMTSSDKFLFFMTNHGGTVSDIGSPTEGDEDFTADKVDECGFYYNSNTVPFDDNVAMLVNSLKFSRMICVMEQCFSGGMIYDLRGANRIIMTAANEIELSFGGAKYDVFCMLFASALLGYNAETLQAVDADANKDGQVSMTEAFRWAKDHDQKDETPQYEDSGDGISINYPSDNGIVQDGAYGKNVFF